MPQRLPYYKTTTRPPAQHQNESFLSDGKSTDNDDSNDKNLLQEQTPVLGSETVVL